MSSMPTWAGFMAPVLTVMNDGQSRTFREIRVAAADVARLTEEQRTGDVGVGPAQVGQSDRLGDIAFDPSRCARATASRNVRHDRRRPAPALR